MTSALLFSDSSPEPRHPRAPAGADANPPRRNASLIRDAVALLGVFLIGIGAGQFPFIYRGIEGGLLMLLATLLLVVALPQLDVVVSAVRRWSGFGVVILGIILAGLGAITSAIAFTPIRSRGIQAFEVFLALLFSTVGPTIVVVGLHLRSHPSPRRLACWWLLMWATSGVAVATAMLLAGHGAPLSD